MTLRPQPTVHSPQSTVPWPRSVGVTPESRALGLEFTVHAHPASGSRTIADSPSPVANASPSTLRCSHVSRDTHHASRFTLHVSRFAFRRSDVSRRPLLNRAFSLLEVMIACGIFFMAIFAILALVAGVLRNARSLRSVDVDAGMVAAQIYKTNKLYEGSESGDFGNAYPEYSWETEITQAATNGLFQVDILVHRRGAAKPVDSMTIFVYAPESPQNGGFGAPRFR